MGAVAAKRFDWRSGPRQMRGLTLIELMIVVVIIGILVTIAYPGYQSQMQKTRRTTGHAALLDSAQRLERCFTRFNAYNNGGCQIAVTLGGAGVQSDGNFYVVTFNGAATASTYSLIATRQGAQANDTLCGDLTLNNAGVQGRTGAAPLDNCW